MKKLNTLLFVYALLLFFHSYSAFSFSLKKSFSLVREKFGQLSVPKKTLVIYAGIVIPHGFWKITQYKKYVSRRQPFICYP